MVFVYKLEIDVFKIMHIKIYHIFFKKCFKSEFRVRFGFLSIIFEFTMKFWVYGAKLRNFYVYYLKKRQFLAYIVYSGKELSHYDVFAKLCQTEVSRTTFTFYKCLFD